MTGAETPVAHTTAPMMRMGLVGGGMFGSDVVLRSIEDLERCGIAPYLGRIGLDVCARDLAPVRFELVAVGTRTASSAARVCDAYRDRLTGAAPKPYHGETPWVEMLAEQDIDVLFVATPDSLHYEPTVAALEASAHVMVEKPLTLSLDEADRIVELAKTRERVVGVDMHKRYDPAHRFIFETLLPQLGTPLYGRAVLEEPLEVSTQTFKWAATSNPFSYVGVHWADLFGHYLQLRPVSLHAVGQKELLARWAREGGPTANHNIDAFDAMQVAVDYECGLRMYYVNNWINPPEFEGAVNQELELVGTRGKVEFDQQYRGLRATITGVGSRTFNPHFTRDVARPDPSPTAYDGYGKDSIIAIVAAAARVHLGLTRVDEVAGTYPHARGSRPTVGLLEAAAVVAQRNLEAKEAGGGTPVTARFSEQGVELLQPGLAAETLYAGCPY